MDQQAPEACENASEETPPATEEAPAEEPSEQKTEKGLPVGTKQTQNGEAQLLGYKRPATLDHAGRPSPFGSFSI